MKIKYYGYNAFLIESHEKKIAIDPGALFLHYFRLTSLIPKTEWKDVTHILVTHGDIDHYWHADRIAEDSNAPVICSREMVKTIDGVPLMLGPRSKGLSFSKVFKKLHTLSVGETIKLDGLSITGIKTIHGPLKLKIGPFSRTLTPGPKERIGWGAIGFKIGIDGRNIVNLGDTILLKDEWKSILNPDVLLIPIGGKSVNNTMDETEAIEAVKIMRPKLVIPCHYNCPALFTKKMNPADEEMFKREVEKIGARCVILKNDQTIDVEHYLPRSKFKAI